MILNALSDFLSGVPAIRDVLRTATSLYVPVIALGEYRYGLRFSKRRDSIALNLREFLEDVTVLEIEDDTTIVYADVRSELRSAGTPIPENDVWIAALVRQYNSPLLSNDSHFDRVSGIVRFNW